MRKTAIVESYKQLDANSKFALSALIFNIGGLLFNISPLVRPLAFWFYLLLTFSAIFILLGAYQIIFLIVTKKITFR